MLVQHGDRLPLVVTLGGAHVLPYPDGLISTASGEVRTRRGEGDALDLRVVALENQRKLPVRIAVAAVGGTPLRRAAEVDLEGFRGGNVVAARERKFTIPTPKAGGRVEAAGDEAKLLGREVRLPGDRANGPCVAAGQGAVGGESGQRKDLDRFGVGGRDERECRMGYGTPRALVKVGCEGREREHLDRRRRRLCRRRHFDGGVVPGERREGGIAIMVFGRKKGFAKIGSIGREQGKSCKKQSEKSGGRSGDVGPSMSS